MLNERVNKDDLYNNKLLTVFQKQLIDYEEETKIIRKNH